jgi:hypothetical protein
MDVNVTSIATAGSISREDALHLIGCSDDDLPELLATARAAKELHRIGADFHRHVGGEVLGH